MRSRPFPVQAGPLPQDKMKLYLADILKTRVKRGFDIINERDADESNVDLENTAYGPPPLMCA